MSFMTMASTRPASTSSIIARNPGRSKRVPDTPSRSEERRVGKEGSAQRPPRAIREKNASTRWNHCGAGAEPDGVSPDACFFFSSRRRHTRSKRDWSSDVCSSDLNLADFQIVTPQAAHVLYDDGLHPSGLDFLHHRQKSGAVKTGSRYAIKIGRASCRERGERAEAAEGYQGEECFDEMESLWSRSGT